MRHEEVIVTYTCDLCKKECEPVRNVSIPHSYIGAHDVVSVEIRVSAIVPYVTECGDVCRDCLMKALSRFMGLPTLEKESD